MELNLQKRLRTGGLAAWSIRRPIAVIMLALALGVIGLVALTRLGIDLLPHIIYPEISIRVDDPGVPARIMEDRITRHLEEQLAITEGAIGVQSSTTEGRSSVNLAFPYGTDIDIALRDASTRLDRARRLLPATIDPPTIFKRDPSQIPVYEFVVSSRLRDSVELREWVDYGFAKWFLNLPGVAAAEVGGAPMREVQIIIDQERLAGLGFTAEDIAEALADDNLDHAGGRLLGAGREFSARSSGRFRDITEIKSLPLHNGVDTNTPVRLGDLVTIRDTYEDERVRVRLDGIHGVKVSIQKQPDANTVAVVDAVATRLSWLHEQGLIPSDIHIGQVGDQSTYVRHALRNASLAALAGAVLAMLVVYLFLGNLRRTLIIGTAIPFAVLVTFGIMDLNSLTLNIMTLGGLALGIGLLVDSTIVMLENIARHQSRERVAADAPTIAAAEVNSPIVAAAITNLAAVVPFLFIGGLIGLLFRELIITISAAILASLLVALTLVPALAARVRERRRSRVRRLVDSGIERLCNSYGKIATVIVRRPWIPLLFFIPSLVVAMPVLFGGQQIFLPNMDEGRITVRVASDPGMPLAETDRGVRLIEAQLFANPDVQTVFSTVGGFVFGRSAREASNISTVIVQLKPLAERAGSSHEWVDGMQRSINAMGLAGFRVHMSVQGVRGIRLGSGEDDISVRVRGPSLNTLASLGDEMMTRLRDVPGVRNLQHSYEEARGELLVVIDRERAAALGVRVSDIGRNVQLALDGRIISDYIANDQLYNVRARLPVGYIEGPDDLGRVVVALRQGEPVRVRDVARIEVAAEPGTIQRDNQDRIVEVRAALAPGSAPEAVMTEIYERLQDMAIPAGYQVYDGGAAKALQEGRQMGYILLALAVFLVFVVMAVQYESLRNPLVILISVPFAVIGVSTAIWHLDLPISMPIWLGMIMLVGIVVNNAIVLVEQIEIEREGERPINEAIVEAARLRLRPILMTTLTTVAGMTPLALGLGEGAEMLRPLAIVIVWGLSFSMLVSLLLVPAVYRIFHPVRAGAAA